MSESERSASLGLVIGGTGVRGFAQAGALAALERAGLAPDVVVGVSTGAIVAAAYAARADWSTGLRSMDRTKLPALAPASSTDDSFARLRATFRNARQLAPSVWTWGRQGYEEYGRVALSELLSDGVRLQRARVPIAQVATDLERGTRAVLDRGQLIPATLAASAMPGIARPVAVSGRLLADGVFSDPAPVDVARALGADRVVVVHAQPPLDPADPDNWILALVRGMEIGQQAFTEERLAEADVVIRVTMDSGMRSLDFAAVDAAARCAGEAVTAEVPRIRALLRGDGTDPATPCGG